MLLVGLGNPGKKYDGTRHNIGFEVINKIISEYDFASPLAKFKGLYSEGEIMHNKVRVLMPQTFMNLSGSSVLETMNFYKEKLGHVVVIHDELDLPLGKLRMKTGGGDGGHNGLRSIDAMCGTEYKRMRIGIGHPGDKNLVSSFVLSKFNNPEKPIVAELVEIIAKKIGYLIEGKDDLFATKFAEEAAKIEALKEAENEIL
jgi:peptidyl-tRNA hydrolase, PTH1 family